VSKALSTLHFTKIVRVNHNMHPLLRKNWSIYVLYNDKPVNDVACDYQHHSFEDRLGTDREQTETQTHTDTLPDNIGR